MVEVLSIFWCALNTSLLVVPQSHSPLEIRLKESEEVQKQLEKRILEAENLRQQEVEQRKKAVDEVEKQVSLCRKIRHVDVLRKRCHIVCFILVSLAKSCLTLKSFTLPNISKVNPSTTNSRIV